MNIKPLDMENLCRYIMTVLAVDSPMDSTMSSPTPGHVESIGLHVNNTFWHSTNTGFVDSPIMSTVSPPDALQNDTHADMLVQWSMPVICIFGAIGNLLNLVVLTLRIREGTELMEKGVLYGLIALALSDFLFCLVTVPWGFIDNHGIVYLHRDFQYYYAIASEPLQVSNY